jgi:hypothetical protein
MFKTVLLAAAVLSIGIITAAYAGEDTVVKPPETTGLKEAPPTPPKTGQKGGTSGVSGSVSGPGGGDSGYSFDSAGDSGGGGGYNGDPNYPVHHQD